MKNNEFQTTINITLMDRDAVEHFTLSEILEMYPDVSGIIINDLEFDKESSVFYATTGLGRVIFPRHLNETLEDIEMQYFTTQSLYYNLDETKVAFKPYQYTFGDRHGYSAKFYKVEKEPDVEDFHKAYTNWNYLDTDNVSDQDAPTKEQLKEKVNKWYKSSTYGTVAKKECKYYKQCMEHDCALCPHCVYFNPYQE